MEDAAEDQVQPQDNDDNAPTLVSTGATTPVNQNEPQPAPPASPSPTTAAQPPTLDEFLKNGPPQNKVPTLDEWMQGGLPSTKDKSTIGALWGGTKIEELSKEQRDAIPGSFIGPYFSAFGASFKEAYNPSLSDETEANFKKYVDGPQYAKGEQPIQNAYLDLLAQTIRKTSAAVVESAEVVGSALWAPIEATQAGIVGVAEKAGFGEAAEFAMSPQAAAIIPGDIFAIGAFFHEGVANGATARAGVWDGTVKATEQEQEIMAGAAKSIPPRPSEIPLPPVTAVPVQDMHSRALQINPEAVGEQIKLKATQEQLRSGYADLREQRDTAHEAQSPYAESIKDNEARLAKTTDPKMKKILNAVLDDARGNHEKWLEENPKTETPAMSATRQKLQDIDYRLQDIAKDGKVGDAYRQAATELENEKGSVAPAATPTPTEHITATPFTPEAVEEKAKEQDNLFTAATEQAKKDKAAGRSDQFSRDKARAAEKAAADMRAAKSEADFYKAVDNANKVYVGNQRTTIMDLHTKMLTDAGVSADVAKADAAKAAAHYIARSERFEGKEGTAEEMYRRDAAEVQKHKDYREFKNAQTVKERANEDEVNKALRRKESAGGKAKASVDLLGKVVKGKKAKAGFTPIQNYLRKKGVKFNAAGEIENIDKVPEASVFNDDMREYGLHATGERVDKDWLEEQLDNERRGKGSMTEEQQLANDKAEEVERRRSVLNEMGLDATKMTDAEIHDALIAHENKRYLTPEAEALLKTVDDGGVPSVMTNNLRKIAEDNGIKVDENTTPEHIITDLKVKQGASAQAPTMADVEDIPMFSTFGVFRTKTGVKPIIALFEGSDVHTLVHETGHEWTKQLAEDSTNPNAPQKLRDDWKTLSEYYGIKSVKAPPKGTPELRAWTAAHERAARGYERYMTLHEAPTKALEPIFKQFKDWLTKIYETFPFPKQKISAEVRGVFDRWHTHENVDIIPDHEAGKLMADAHEIDNGTTEPKDAMIVRDNAIGEVDKTIQQHIPEALDGAKSAESAAETGGATGEATIPTESSEGTGLAEGAASGAEEHPEIATGDSGVKPEGSGVRTESTTAGSAAAEPAGKSTEPSWESQWDSAVAKVGGNPVGKSDEIIKNLLGNIRLENLTDSGKLQDFMRFVAKKMNVRFDTPVTDDMALDLAQAVGDRNLNMEFLRDITNKDGIPLSVRVAVGRETLRNGMQNLQEMQSRLNQSGSDADALEFQKALVTQKFFMETISGVAGESGRTLRAFKNIADTEMKNADEVNDLFQKMTGKTPKQIREISAQMQLVFDSSKDNEIEGGANPEMAEFVARMNDPKWYDYILAYRNNAILSGPITHMHYIDAGLINALYDPAKVAIASAFSKDVHLGEAGAMYHALIGGSIKGLKVAAEVIKNGNEADIPEILKSDLSKIKLPLGLDYPTRILSGVHVFMKNLRYEQEIARSAFRSAIHDGLTEGTPEFNNRVSNLQVNPTAEVMQAALKTAKLETYLSDLDRSSFTGKMVSALGSNPVAQLFVPFAKMEANIKFRTLQEVPIVNLLTKETRENLSGIAGYDEGIEALATKQAREEGLVEGDKKYTKRINELKEAPTDEMKQAALSDAKAKQAVQIAAIGMSGILGGMVIGFQKNINGNGPIEPKSRAEWLLTHTPNSIQIGDFAIPMKALGKAGLALGMMAELRDGVYNLTDEENKNAASEFVSHLSTALLSGTFVDNLSRISDAMQHKDTKGAKFIQGMADEFLPFNAGMNQINREFIDPDYRDVRSEGAKNFWGIIDSMKSRTPFLSQSLPAKNDMFGQPIMNDSLYFHTTQPEQAYRYQNDPVVQTMDRLGKGMTMVSRDIHGVKLTGDQYNEYSQKAGVITKMRLDNLVKTDGFQAMPRKAQIERIGQEIKVSRNQARNLIMAKYPEIMRQAVAQKRAALGR